MQSRAKLLGHPIHPMLVALPIGLFAVSLVFDLVAIAAGPPQLGFGAFWCILGGAASGIVAAVFGLVDWLAVPKGTRAKRIGAWHLGFNLVVVALFVVSWLTRIDAPNHDPTWFAVGLEIAGVALMLVSGWLGGELVDRLGVGVDDRAGVDAPSSLA